MTEPPEITVEGDLTDDERTAAHEAAAEAIARTREIEARKHCPDCEAEILCRSEQTVLGGPVQDVLLELDPTVPAEEAAVAYIVPAATGTDFLPVVPVGGDVAIHTIHRCPDES